MQRRRKCNSENKKCKYR